MAHHFGTSIDIAAPPERVWALMFDVERWATWTASIASVALREPGPLRVGSRARVRQPKLPSAVWRVTAVEAGHRFTWVSGTPLARVVADHVVDPTMEGSRATLSVDYSGPLAGLLVWMIGDLNDRYIAMEAAGLKQRAERG